MALEHLAGDLDVDGVDVVEKAGREEAAELEDGPGEEDEGEGAWAPAAGGRGLSGVIHLGSLCSMVGCGGGGVNVVAGGEERV